MASPDLIAALLDARRHRPAWPGIDKGLAPRTIEDGYAAQAAMHVRLAAAGTRRSGYKIGSTSERGQKHLGLEAPIYAGIFDDTRAKNLAEGLSRRLAGPLVECEIAFVLDRDLDAVQRELTAADVIGAVATCHLACEIIDNRYGAPLEVGVPTMLADDFFHSGFVLGPPNPGWRSLEFASLDASIEIDGIFYRGNAADVLSATDAMLWLAKQLSRRGARLRAGEIILTGSIVSPVELNGNPRTLKLSIDGFEPLALA